MAKNNRPNPAIKKARDKIEKQKRFNSQVKSGKLILRQMTKFEKKTGIVLLKNKPKRKTQMK